MVLFDLIGRRWVLRILWEIHLCSPDPITFRNLQRRCDDMSSSVLSQRLGELTDARLVMSTAGAYVLSADGVELVAMLLPLHQWATEWVATAP